MPVPTAAAAVTLITLVLGAAPPEPLSPRATVTALADLVEREYFDAATAARVASDLRKQAAAGLYEGQDSPHALAAALTADLRAATGDKHLAVSVQAPAGNGSAGPRESREERGRRENFGLVRVEILPGNVGYLRIDAFYRLAEARVTIDAAMTLLRHAGALIIDLRSNGGGAPDTVAYLASYLFEPSAQPLFEIVPRHGDINAYPVVKTTLNASDAARPVYVLTSAATFSAGEGLAFVLQARHRAAVVGERTAGAANPGRSYPVTPGFEATIPNGSVRVAGTPGNWEGTGVVPDEACAASDALAVAQERARARLRVD